MHASYHASAQRFARIHQCMHADGRVLLERVLTTCSEMLADRGCVEVERMRSVDECLAQTEATSPAVRGRGGPTDVNVYVHGEDRVGVKFARAVLEDAERAGVPSVVVVSPEGATPFTLKECQGRHIQFWRAKDLCFNVTRHCLVPKHTPIDAPPKGVLVGELPRMLDTDVVARYYDWSVDTVVRIERTFGGHEPIPYFRVVVDGGCGGSGACAPPPAAAAVVAGEVDDGIDKS